MYTSTIGRTFLNAYNEKYNFDYTAESFFKEVFVPLFFDHPKYMMTAGNSPLENPKLSWEDMIKGKKLFETAEHRAERISKMFHKIETEKASDTIARGYPIPDDTAGTSGQKTNIPLSDDKDAIYLSWIGEGLGIGITGGVSILFNYSEILLDVFDGWKYYRDRLERTPILKGNQINTWNGRWIAHRYDTRSYEESNPMNGLNDLFSTENSSDGVLNISTINWVNVLLGISLRYPIDNLVGYLYSIGQTNTTLGFIPFKLDEIKRPHDFYRKIFGSEDYGKNMLYINQLYSTSGVRIFCQLGSVGVKAMEPKGLKAYLPTNKGNKKISVKDGEERLNFNTYLIWILAMLNNEQLWDISLNAAKLLLQYEKGAGKTKTDRTNKVNTLLESSTPRQFLQNMIPLIEEYNEGKSSFEELGKIVHTMPRDNFSYFNTLIRFQYALQNN
ncbi:hypothetical protein EZS27_021979 [termite gut metagenome]|uniref:Uncharacterized protein n=1 Tax=termite gut metagenome TaxID=433724 RepID=A0A5J4R6D7_9ZZZZ